jgi:hypothetical protein
MVLRESADTKNITAVLVAPLESTPIYDLH